MFRGSASFGSLISAVCILASVLLLLPSIIYLIANAGWKERRQRIFTYFESADLKRYFGLYFPSLNIADDSDADLLKRFKKHYGCYYGRRHFIAPLILLAGVSGIGVWGTAETLKSWEGVLGAKFALPAIVVSAFAGAYTWVTSDHLARMRRRDLNSADVYNGVFRFLIAVPFAISFSALANKDLSIAIAFLIGVFPTTTIFTIGRRIFSKLGLGEDPAAGQSELEKLQNIGKTNAERFHDEGVTTIAELAWTDPVDLAVRTNFEFNYVMDCMGQALLAVYVGDDIKKVSPFSLRAAQDAASMIRDVGKDIDCANLTADQKYAREALAQAAAVLQLKPQALYYTLSTVAEDPYTEFLWRIWPRGIQP
jgi:hypothetical protein